MADLSDVENGLVALLATSLLPVGYRTGDAVASNLGPRLRIYRGWPNGADLDTDLFAGQDGAQGLSAYIVNISVFPESGGSRNTTRYERIWRDPNPLPLPTFTATVVANAVIFSGAVSSSQIAGLQVGTVLPPALYRLKATDTPSTVAAVLAGLMGGQGATVSGATVTFPTAAAGKIVARTAQDAISMLEVRRQEQSFRITVWAPTPAIRDLIGSAVDNLLAIARSVSFPDGTASSIITARGTSVDDVPEKASLWRRDFRYAIEYPTVQTQVFTPVLFPIANTNGNCQPPLGTGG